MSVAGPTFLCRHDAHRWLHLAAALRTISRLRRGLLDAAERSALLRRVPRAAIPRGPMPGDPVTPLSPRSYAPPPPRPGSRLDAMA